jgi:hypothetical protein
VIWFGLFGLFSVLVDLILAGRLAHREKDVEIVLLDFVEILGGRAVPSTISSEGGEK